MLKKWTTKEVENLFKKPFFDLIYEAQKTHRKNFIPGKIQISTLLSIKTGACPEDCKYCPQSARYNTGLKKENLIKLNKVIEEAKKAKKNGSTRFCMGAAWKNPKDKDIPLLQDMIKNVKKIGLETCMTLGMLTEKQAVKLSESGLDYYNHNLDTSPELYKKIITTRTYEERLKTLKYIRKSGIKICSGGIIGLGENLTDKANLLVELANLPKQPESVPINMLVKIKGTPLSNNKNIDPFDFIRTIAVTRIIMPKSYVRLSAGRENMNEQTQALCFIAGANSIFYGCKLLTTKNPEENKDLKLFKKLDINIEHINIKKGNNELKNHLTKKVLDKDKDNYYKAIN